MIKRLVDFQKRHPFTALMLIAIIVRLLVVIFAQGYGSHAEMQRPSLIFALMKHIQRGTTHLFHNENVAMFLSRAFYTLVSLFTISMVYRITDLLSNKKTAWIIALIPTFSCIMPSFGIISGINAFVAAPFLLYGCMVVLRQEILRKAQMNESVHRTSFFFAGLGFGLAACIWPACVLFILSILLILLILKNPKGALITLLGCVVTIALIVIILLLCHINPLDYMML